MLSIFLNTYIIKKRIRKVKKMSLNIIISVVIMLMIITLLVGIIKYRENIRYKKLKNIESLNVIENENGILSFEDEGDREVIRYYINKTYEGLEDIYNNNTWDNKRYLYRIMKNINDLKEDVEFNKLAETDIEKINSIICVYRVNKKLEKSLENIIFEWENNYLS